MARLPGVLVILRVACAARTAASLPSALVDAGRPDTCPAHVAELGTSVHHYLSYCDYRVPVSGGSAQGGPTPNPNQSM
eukprot:1369167-Alexandrium_andersonii.AAC.1